MSKQPPHPEALGNVDRAHLPDSKIRDYTLVSDKRRPFEALGFSEQAGNWEALRDAILEGLLHHPATYHKENEYGTFYEVVLSISGPTGKEAPVKTIWFYQPREDFPRLATLYINVKDWTRWEQESGDATEAES